jgi:hypothetical protein
LECAGKRSGDGALDRLMKRRIILVLIVTSCVFAITAAQTRRRKRVPTPSARTQAPRASAAKYSVFLHSSEKHKGLACNDCHKLPTAWTAKRDFPDVADFPDHDACVRCHRQQFFTRQALVGTGPAICTVCHVRAAPREDKRFAFGKPNTSNQATKAKDERQFTIEFPHDKHQNVIARLQKSRRLREELRFIPAAFFSSTADDKKPDYNNCSICHQTNKGLAIVNLPTTTTDPSLVYPFKAMPRSHDACFDCHWQFQEPLGRNCGGCHKLSEKFVAVDTPKRISAKFAHEGGKGEHVAECTTCHINITRASTLRGLTPDVPINACASCHRDSKKTTYPKAVTIETELEQFKTTGNCTYCHTPDVGKKQPPASHNAAVQ